MSEYRVIIKGSWGSSLLPGTLPITLNREQAQQLADSLASQGVGVSLGIPDNRPLWDARAAMDRPSPGRPIAVQCPRCGGMRVRLEWSTYDQQVYITQCLDCEERRAREVEAVKESWCLCVTCKHQQSDQQSDQGRCVGRLVSITENNKGWITECTAYEGR